MVTGMLATVNTVLGLDFMLGATSRLTVSCVDTLVLDEEATREAVFTVASLDTIALSGQAIGDCIRVAPDTLVLSDEAIADVDVVRLATDTLVLSGVAAGVAILLRSAGDALVLSDEAPVSKVLVIEGYDSLVLSDDAAVIQSVSDTLVLSDEATVDRIIGVGDTLVLDDAASCVVDFSRGVSDSLTLAETVIPGFVAERSATDALVLSDVAVGDYCQVAEDALVLDDTATFEFVRLIADTLELTDAAAFIGVFGVEASDTLVVADEVHLDREIDAAASDALSLLDQAGLLHDAADTLVLADVASADYSKVAYDELTYTELAEVTRDRADASDALVFTEIASVNIIRNVSVRDNITTLTDFAWPGFQRVTAIDVLQYTYSEYDPYTYEETVVYDGLQDTAEVSVIYAEPKEAEDHLSFGESASCIRINAAAVAVSASDSLTLTDLARTNLTPAATDSFVPTDVADVTVSKLLADGLVLLDAASYNIIRNNLTASDTLVLSEAVLWYDQREDYLHVYHPFVGAGTGGVPTPPDEELEGPIVGITDPFKLVYPVAGPFSDTLLLRAPNLGNRDRLQMSRVSRETRGGTLVVYADPMWPKIQTLALDFSGLSWAEASGLQTFMDAHLGLEIGMLDWEHRFWSGIITDLAKPVVQDGRGNKYSVGFEFEGEMATYDPGP